ncbi:ABC transporter ATP-binding protein [Anaerosphaera multitolerans]|uniref:ABC transporter ATP-binding protein n=1 Tax=Anaerosphaera multitolerans TaxID=2487351 RepID=A0A437S8U5_9FIRM|nr:dipeptide/oligopeptide/nickel ABC transporter ATP-binding protein [Anaerosphaera multitolerans]RVU55529.1 ABC transporter ATP-binding protein [Anaerosphaera multitolerans]
MEEIIRLENVSKKYKGKSKSIFEKPKEFIAVNDVSFSINKGEIFGLVGESGSGKTTLGHLIIGLKSMSQGKIYFKGRDISTFTREEEKKWRKQVQIIFQNPYSALDPKRKIGWSIEEILMIHKIGDKASRRKMAEEILYEVEIDPSLMDQYPEDLSGGQRQRVSIASALIVNPEFVIIDEGVSALDVSVQSAILNLIRKLQEKRQFTCLFISHDLNVIEYLCDRVGVMYKGEMVEIFNAGEFFESEHHEYTQKLFSTLL